MLQPDREVASDHRSPRVTTVRPFWHHDGAPVKGRDTVPRIAHLFIVLLSLSGLAACAPTALDLYRDDQVRQGKAPSGTPTVAACDLVPIARLPIEMRGRLLTVPISINDQTLRMVVDSGAERTTISENAAGRLKLPRDMQRIQTSRGVGGDVTSADAVVSSFVLGNVRLPPLERVAVGRFGFDADANPLADGLLGADVLLAFDLDIDVPGKTLTIYRVRRCPNSEPPWQEPFVAVQGVTARKDRLLIPFQLDGVSGTAILDTGASATTIGVQMAKRLGLNEQTMALDRKVVQRGAGTGSITAHYHWFKELRVGPAIVRGLMLTVLPTDAGVGDALIGQDFLQGRRVWLSFPTRQVFVSKLEHELPPR